MAKNTATKEDDRGAPLMRRRNRLYWWQRRKQGVEGTKEWSEAQSPRCCWAKGVASAFFCDAPILCRRLTSGCAVGAKTNETASHRLGGQKVMRMWNHPPKTQRDWDHGRGDRSMIAQNKVHY